MDTIEDIARIHKEQLRGTDILSSCSINTIKLFYRDAEKMSSAVLLTENINGKTAGFVYGCTGESSPVSAFLKKHFLRVLFTPSSFYGVISAVLNRLLFRSGTLEYINELVYIAVDKNQTGKGIATGLIASLEKEFLKRNVKEYYLQVFKENPAVNLYLKLNFTIAGEIKKLNNNKYLMKKIIG